MIAAALFGILVTVAIAAALARDRSTTAPPTTVAASATSTTPPTTTSTVPPTSTTEVTTTEATTTTTTTSTTTTLVPPIVAEGEPLPLADLTLGAFAIGPFPFESSGFDVAARFAATLGVPDAVHAADTEWGLCDGDAGLVVSYGPLDLIFLGRDEPTLVGYRLGPLDVGEADHPAAGLTTISGLRIGHTVADLRAIYANSTVDFVEIDGRPHFRLLRSSDQATLLWGPVTSTDPEGTILGIFSPRPCDGGP